MCSGLLTSSAKGAIAAWAASALGGVDVEQNGTIALDDQRIVGGIGHQAQDESWVSAAL
jgi:hypothetical protein